MLRVGALLAAVTVACSASAVQAAYPGANGRVVFVESADGRGGSGWGPVLVTVNPDGSGGRQLSRGPLDGAWGEFDPAWSPDGSQIAYVRSTGRAIGPGTRGNEIWVMRSDGSRKRRLTRNALFDGSPTWSPDGRSIVFVRGLVFEASPARRFTDLWTMQANGSRKRRLARTPQLELEPAWAPSGGLLAFVVPRSRACDSTRCPRELWLSRAGGGGRRRMSLDAELQPSSPDWSPDGSRLAIGTRDGVVVLSPDGANARVLSPGVAGAWSPDGSALVVAEPLFSADFTGLRIVGLDGTSRPLTRNPAPSAELLVDHGQPDWQPLRR